jgi:hypothetical protein
LLKKPKLALLLALMMSASLWFYVQRILIPYQQADAAAHGRPRGILSDLYPRWVGARELLLHHRDPYSSEVTREIQLGYYGRLLDSEHADDPKDEQRFAYPVYVVFLLAPTVKLPFSAVQAGFKWFLIVLTGASVLLWLRALRWRPSMITTAILVVLVLSSFPAVQGIKLQQLSLVVSGLVAGSAALLAGGHLVLAGILLGIATIKPQLVLPVAGGLLLWAVGDWRRRQQFVWSFLLAMAALVGAGEIILPGWIGRFREAVAAYRQYTGGAGSLLDVLITPAWGGVLAGIITLALAVVCWRLRRADPESEVFHLVLALMLAVTVVIVPMVAPYNQLLLLPAILLIVRHWNNLWRRNAVTRWVSVVAGAVVLWPWFAAVILTAASFALPPTSVQEAWAVPLYTSLAIPLAVAALLSFQVADARRSGKAAGGEAASPSELR